MIGALWIGEFTFLALFLFIIIASQLEYYRLADKLNINTRKTTGVISGVLVMLLGYFHAKNILQGQWLILPILALVLIPLIEMIKDKSKTTFSNFAHTLFGIIYVAVPLSFANYLVFTDLSMEAYNHHLLLAIFVLIWTYDTFAYLTGKYFGRHKLLEKVSPKKTWEGTLGGVIMSAAGGWLIYWFTGHLTWQHWIIIAILTAFSGTVGDLTESAFKRQVGVKDSGKILPGHGGMLDRFDAALFAIPVVTLYFYLVAFS
jgi:phosphatidate cytidylyltransferase